MSRCKACNEVFTDLEMKSFKVNDATGEQIPDDLCYKCREYAYSKYNITNDRYWAFGDLDMPEGLLTNYHIDE